jgi:hypothetical protein
MKKALPYLLFLLFLSILTIAQQTKPNFDPTLYEGVKWRELGPFRGGRSCTVTGVKGKPNLYYFGAVGGGVWRSNDAGQTWGNISDNYFGGTIGAIAVAESDQNVIFVGEVERYAYEAKPPLLFHGGRFISA